MFTDNNMIAVARSMAALPRLRRAAITNGLTAALVPINGGIFDAVSRRVDATTFGTSPAYQLPGNVQDVFRRAYVGIDNAGATGGAIFAAPGAVLCPLVSTHIIVGQPRSLSGGFAGFMCVGDAAGTTAYWSFQDTGSSSTAGLWLDNASSANIAAWSAINTQPHTFGFGDSNTGTGIDYWLDGVLQSSLVGIAPVSPPTDARCIFFGERGASTTYCVRGGIYLHLIYDRKLSDEEQKAIGKNAFSEVFEDDEIMVFEAAAAAFQPAWAVASNSVFSSGALTA